MNIRAKAALLLVVSATSGCADSTSAIVQSLRYTVQGGSADVSAKLDPALRYLRATVRGKPALLVLGYVEPDPRGPIQVWYSAQREVVRIQNGRIVGAAGMVVEWRNVQLSDVPSWAAIARDKATSILRVRDVMPGYRYGVRDTLSTRATPAPPRSALRDLDPQSLAWFEESADGDAVARGVLDEKTILPVSRYAVSFRDGSEEVVYGEQCLSAELCFTWQRWPAVPPSPNPRK